MTDTIDREAAAQLAESANVKRDHDLATATPDYLDGYQAGYEKAAAIIRESGDQSAQGRPTPAPWVHDRYTCSGAKQITG
jgi:hypothetical protein